MCVVCFFSGLLALYRTACLKHNDEGAAVLLNLLLRNYLEYNLYDQAHKLISKTTLREDSTVKYWRTRKQEKNENENERIDQF